MTRFVIDAPIMLGIAAGEIGVAPGHQLVAPSLIRSQALALLFERVRRGDLTEKEALRHHERITELKMRLLGDRVSRRTAWDLAREHGWDTTYEAEYIAVAKLQADALVTENPTLATKAEGIVVVAPASALTRVTYRPADLGAGQ